MIALPYGIEDFRRVIEENCYYVDKTGFIKELLSEKFAVNLITRPRRFGKTLTMKMLTEFFDIRKESKALFNDLEISKDTTLCKEYMNQWPVLSLTLKDISGKNFNAAYGRLKHVISTWCIEHAYLENSDKVSKADKESFCRMMFKKPEEADVEFAIDTLLRMVSTHYGKQTILLIDEYDVPLAKASSNGYYEDMLDIIRGLLSAAWKSNDFLKFSIVTGCLHIAKESIFTGANNFISNSISDTRYNHYIGFTGQEVKKMLDDASLSSHLEEIKKWYDGYIFGGVEIYCPWDVINHIRDLGNNPVASPRNHWTDTSHNDIIRKFIENPHFDVKAKFEILLAGGIIWETIVEDMTYDLVNSSENNLWSILYLTGYLTQADIFGDKNFVEKIPLRIPNEEVKSVFASNIKKWFEDTVQTTDRHALFNAWWTGDTSFLTDEISNILNDTISYYDYKEDYYHAFIAGIFTGAGYVVESNTENGLGRTDVVVKDRKNRRAIIIEAKHSKSEKEATSDCDKALKQIADNNYDKKLKREYINVICYGASFFGKRCLIKKSSI